MAYKRQKGRRRGHFCWACGQVRASEKFSGKGHPRHLCKDCARLGKAELKYRQVVRSMERLVSWHEFIPRKKRPLLNEWLAHKNERVRAYALELEIADAWARAEQRLYRDLDEVLEGLTLEELGLAEWEFEEVDEEEG